jgi:hypothetical protein
LVRYSYDRTLKGASHLLNEEQRAELEALGPENIRVKLNSSGAGRGADVAGFKSGRLSAGYLTRGDVEDWLSEQYVAEAKDRKSTLRWAKIAGWSAIVGVAVGITAIIVSIWLARD